MKLRAVALASCIYVSFLPAYAPAQIVAQPEPQPEQIKPYEGMRLVRVRPLTRGAFSDALDTAHTVWTHRPGFGRDLDVIVDAEGLASLRGLGLEPVVLSGDVQGDVDEQMASIEAAKRQRGASFFTTYRDLAEITTRINDLAAARPDIAQTFVVGQSLQGRDILGLRITAPGDASERAGVLLNGCQHAREWISPMTITYFADRLVNDAGTDPRIDALLDDAVIYLVPVVNPDGYVYSWTSQRLWRKNRRNNGNGTFGVDLNRNWDFQWGGPGSSGNTDSEIYRGPSPFSEPEAAAMRDFTLNTPGIAAHIDYHNFSQVILWPYTAIPDLPPEPDLSAFIEISQAMSDAIASETGFFYDAINGQDFDVVSGDMSDWHYGDRGIFSMAVELRDLGQSGFLLPAAQIEPTARENYEAVLLFADFVSRPLRLTLGASTPTTLAAGEPAGFSVSIAAGSATLDTGSVTLQWRDGPGAFTQVPLADAGGGAFAGSITPDTCGSTVEYFFRAATTSGQTVTLPDDAPAQLFSADVFELAVAFEDDVETQTGWTVGAPGDGATTGVWERGDPVGTAAQPENDNSAPGVNAWITGLSATSLGSNDVDSGVTTLTSPRLDASGDGDAVLSYFRWYSNNQGASPNQDSMLVEISNDDGQSWTLLEEVSENANAWVRRDWPVADTLAPTDQLRVRFIARDLGDGSIVEAGVDDVSLIVAGCPDAGCSPADLAEPFGALDFNDVVAFLNAFSAMDAAADLADPIGAFDFNDVVAFLNVFAAGCP